MANNKFISMVDEMTRFEEEIGLPYIPEMDGNVNIMQQPVAIMPQNKLIRPANPIVSQPFVIGTNTFSQAQQKIMQVTDGVPNTMFVPQQILQRPASDPIPGGIPPPPAPPMSMPPAGMTFPPRMPMPYNQPIPPPPQPPNFAPPMVPIGPPAPAIPPTANAPMAAAPTAQFPRRPAPTVSSMPPTSWPAPRTNSQQVSPTKTESQAPKPSDEPPKIVLSATPKLYVPKIMPTVESPSNSHFVSVEPSKPVNVASSNSFIDKKPKQEPSKSAATMPTTAGDPLQPPPNKKSDKKKKKVIRVSGGQTWEDPTLTEWEDGDFRLFAGDLGNDVTDELLTRIFSKYPSFMRARVVRDKRTNKTKGFGFISFRDPQDFIRASKEMNGRYVGSRPIKLRKSTWKNRSLETAKKKEKEKAALISLFTGKP